MCNLRLTAFVLRCNSSNYLTIRLHLRLLNFNMTAEKWNRFYESGHRRLLQLARGQWSISKPDSYRSHQELGSKVPGPWMDDTLSD